MTEFPWEAAMRFGFGVLKLNPAQFWAMTPRELASAVSAQPGRRGGTAPSRDDLETLIAIFPDREKSTHDR